MIKNIDELNQQIRKMPLAERINRVREAFTRWLDDQPVRRSIPAQPTDDDLLLPVTLDDCAELQAECDRLRGDLNTARRVVEKREGVISHYRAILEKALPIIQAEADSRDLADAEPVDSYWTEMRELANEFQAALEGEGNERYTN